MALASLRTALSRAGRTKSADFVLAAIVVAVVGLMVVPLPTALLDLLLATNLAVSLAILLVTLYVTDALQIAAFPTLLLITTLVRLALNISSTRLILLQADAGEVISAFGSFVVRGNYVVGAVVFLILAIIQFVVIAKGSERVAEVGARFSLDALPGKQMAIDADLRTGIIDAAEAGRRRRALERENQFYGAMDGAVRFVKGDVIASFIITAINITGGLAIGVGQRGLGWEAALKKYGLLTIGDGLVTQIPALLVATGAGILVTRVASERSETALGEELSTQLFSAPRALLSSGLFVGALAIVPGLPAVPFLVIGALLLLASRARNATLRRARERATEEPIVDDLGGQRFVPVVVAWSMEVSPDLADLMHETRQGRPSLDGIADEIRRQLFRELGVPLPPCRVFVSAELSPGHLVLAIQEIPALVIRRESDESLEGLRVRIRQTVFDAMADRAQDFVGLSETQSLLDQLAQVAPATVRAVVPKPVSVAKLAAVLRRLLDERVGVRDLKGILEALARFPGPHEDVVALTEHVRAEMRRPLSYELTGGDAELSVFLLDSMIEESIKSAIAKTSAGRFLALAPAAARDIVQSLAAAIGEAADPVVLTQPEIRCFVRQLLQAELPRVRVVSHAELLPQIVVKPIRTVSLAG